MIEFDVRSRRGVLVLAHGVLPVRRGGWLALDEALDHLCQPRFAGIGLNVDVKARGYERATLTALRTHGLIDRALISSQCPAVIERVIELDRRVATAISVGGPVARCARRWSPHGRHRGIVEALRSGRFGDLMVEHRLVDAALMAAVERAGRRLYAWTVDDPRRFAALTALGVTGVVTGNPRALATQTGTG